MNMQLPGSKLPSQEDFLPFDGVNYTNQAFVTSLISHFSITDGFALQTFCHQLFDGIRQVRLHLEAIRSSPINQTYLWNSTDIKITASGKNQANLLLTEFNNRIQQSPFLSSQDGAQAYAYLLDTELLVLVDLTMDLSTPFPTQAHFLSPEFHALTTLSDFLTFLQSFLNDLPTLITKTSSTRKTDPVLGLSKYWTSAITASTTILSKMEQYLSPPMKKLYFLSVDLPTSRGYTVFQRLPLPWMKLAYKMELYRRLVTQDGKLPSSIRRFLEVKTPQMASLEDFLNARHLDYSKCGFLFLHQLLKQLGQPIPYPDQYIQLYGKLPPQLQDILKSATTLELGDLTTMVPWRSKTEEQKEELFTRALGLFIAQVQSTRQMKTISTPSAISGSSSRYPSKYTPRTSFGAQSRTPPYARKAADTSEKQKAQRFCTHCATSPDPVRRQKCLSHDSNWCNQNKSSSTPQPSTHDRLPAKRPIAAIYEQPVFSSDSISHLQEDPTPDSSDNYHESSDESSRYELSSYSYNEDELYDAMMNFNS